MWDFIQLVFQDYGLLALIQVVEAIAIVYLFRLSQRKQDEIVTLYKKRVEDVSESKEAYEELAHKLDQSIDLLIKVFKRNGG
jgi:ABC-type lipoprotein export system ATPase subunit